MEGGAQQPFNQTQTVHLAMAPLGTESQSMQCSSCHQQIRTAVTSQASTKTHLIALLLCLLGCCPCACIPYCVDSCQTQKHNCPNCGAFLGEHKN